MNFVSIGLQGAYMIELDRRSDERGFFARIWCRDEFLAHGLNPNLAQCSISRSRKAGTLRGMHFQRAPHAEAKLVRCTRGAIFDVIVDLRPGSPTHAAWYAAELTEERGDALYVPEGFAHGFQTLVDDTEVTYLISSPYAPDAATGVRWNDPAFGIDWPKTPERTLSDRDRAWPDYLLAVSP